MHCSSLHIKHDKLDMIQINSPRNFWIIQDLKQTADKHKSGHNNYVQQLLHNIQLKFEMCVVLGRK